MSSGAGVHVPIAASVVGARRGCNMKGGEERRVVDRRGATICTIARRTAVRRGTTIGRRATVGRGGAIRGRDWCGQQRLRGARPWPENARSWWAGDGHGVGMHYSRPWVIPREPRRGRCSRRGRRGVRRRVGVAAPAPATLLLAAAPTGLGKSRGRRRGRRGERRGSPAERCDGDAFPPCEGM
mgnify:CR=1 FL=1